MVAISENSVGYRFFVLPLFRSFQLCVWIFPWVRLAELLPNESKSGTSGLAGCVNWILVFSMTNLYGIMVEKLGQIITFGIFVGMSIL
jgi:hypothetical protein